MANTAGLNWVGCFGYTLNQKWGKMVQTIPENGAKSTLELCLHADVFSIYDKCLWATQVEVQHSGA